MKRLFYKSMLFLLISKSLSVYSPFCLKIVVNALSMPIPIDFTTACLGILGFGVIRMLGTVFNEFRMN